MKNNLIISRTDETPEVNLNKDEGLLFFAGKSFPENAEEFFSDIMNWIDEYIHEPHEETEVIFKLEYFNTSSSKKFLEILLELEKIFNLGKNVMVRWLCYEEDEDMKIAGKKFSFLTKLPFEIEFYQ